VPDPTARARFLSLVETALRQGNLVKLTVGKPAPTASSTPSGRISNIRVRC
jgi:hypothetical protein